MVDIATTTISNQYGQLFMYIQGILKFADVLLLQIVNFIFKDIHCTATLGHLIAFYFGCLTEIWKAINLFYQLYCIFEEALDRVMENVMSRPRSASLLQQCMRYCVAVIRLLEGMCGEDNLEYPAVRYPFQPLRDDAFFFINK